MFQTLPKNPKDVLPWSWEKYQPYVDDLLAREINAGNVHQAAENIPVLILREDLH